MTIPIEYFAVTRENVKLKKLHVTYRVSITAVVFIAYAKVTKVVFTACAKVTTVVVMAWKPYAKTTTVVLIAR